jgi:hypothetical protein
VIEIGVMVKIGIIIKVKIKQDVPWFALKFALSAYSIPRLVYLILRLVNFKRLKCLLMMAWVFEIEIETETNAKTAISSSS